MVPTTEKYCFSDFEAYVIAFCYMNQFMMKKKLCRKAFRCLSIWVTGKNAYTRIIFMRENDCLMIYFNFYFVMSVCLWRYALFDGSKEGQTLQSSGFLAGITGSCQKSHLDSVYKLFLTAWPCLQPCKYFKAFIYNCDIRKQGKTHTNEKPWACKQYGEVFRHQSYLQFQEKKKTLFHFFIIRALKQVNCLPCSPKSDFGDHSIVVCSLKLLEQVLNYIWQIHLPKFIWWLISSFIDFCLSSVVI